MEITEILNKIGQTYTTGVSQIIGLIPPEFLTNPLTIKLISLIIPFILIILVIKVITSLKPVVKYIIIGLSILLVISVLTTFMA